MCKETVKIMRAKYGLWYLYREGKVRIEWVRDICSQAGIDADTLSADVWHEIPTDNR